jgi:hypothetical protein
MIRLLESPKDEGEEAGKQRTRRIALGVSLAGVAIVAGLIIDNGVSSNGNADNISGYTVSGHGNEILNLTDKSPNLIPQIGFTCIQPTLSGECQITISHGSAVVGRLEYNDFSAGKYSTTDNFTSNSQPAKDLLGESTISVEAGQAETWTISSNLPLSINSKD